ncbi:MAG: hypothetical protein AB7R89_03415 [Dehalococcoidia bacterium]
MKTNGERTTNQHRSSGFAGFDPPTANWFRMPDNWVDISAGITSLAELKVVQYILRHTWGYREYDIKKHITVDEFVSGRKRRDGSRMDRGTGLAEQSVRNGLEAAKRDGFVEEFVDDTDRARIKKYYGLTMRAAVGEPQDHDGSNTDTNPPQRMETEVQDLDPEVQRLDPRGPEVGPRTETTTKNETFEMGNGSTIASSATLSSRPAASSALRRPIDASDETATTASRIQAVINELSQTFHDDAHRGSNAAQAMNLYLTSGIGVAAFEQQLFEAAAITKDAAQRRRRSTKAAPIERPMAFFFTVLRDALEHAPLATVAAREETP